MSEQKFRVKYGLAVGDNTTETAMTVDGTTGNIITAGTLDVQGGTVTDSTGALSITTGAGNGDITLDPNGTGQVVINSNLDVNGSVTVDSLQIDNININGNTISSTDTDGNINIIPNGSGDVFLTTDVVYVGDANATAFISTNGTGNLVLNTNANVNSGNITITQGVNGNISLTPNGTGSVALTLADGGNLTNTRNYVKGVIRNSTLAAAGEIWALNSTGPVNPFQGISIDNSADTTTGPGTVLRSFSGGAVAGSGARGRLIFEKARGTSASPTAVQQGDFLGSIDATGYTSTGWINDNISATIPGFFGFTAIENWISNTNLGTSFSLSLAPSATTITTSANLVNTITSSPQNTALRGDLFAIGQGKTSAFAATGCSTSGSTLTIGTVTSGAVAVGQLVQTATSAFSQATYIVSGSGSTWTLNNSVGTTSGQTVLGQTGFLGSPTSGGSVDALADLRLLTNNIEGSSGTIQITTSASGTTLALAGNTVNLNNAAGTNLANLTQDNLGGGLTNTVLNIVKANSTGTTPEVAVVNLTSIRPSGTASVSGDKLGQFKFNGSTTAGVVGPIGSVNLYAADNFTVGAQGGQLVFQINKIGTTTSYNAIDVTSAQAFIASDIITLENNSGTNYAVFNSTSATFVQPVGFPVKTATQWNAITGAVGQQVCVSDSPTVAGKMAYWSSTATAGWRYIDTNLAI
jgi:hypothetical protein